MPEAQPQEGTAVIPDAARSELRASRASGRVRSVAQFVEWRVRRAWRNRRCAAAGATARAVSRSITAGVRAGDDVAEGRCHFLNAERPGGPGLLRRSDVVIGRCRLCRGRRCRKDECCDERKFVHDRIRLSCQSQPVRSIVCSLIGCARNSTAQAGRLRRETASLGPLDRTAWSNTPWASISCDIGHRLGIAGVRETLKRAEV
jgi:hypothetical protein